MKKIYINNQETSYSATEDGEIFNRSGKSIKISDKGTVQLFVNKKNKSYSVGKIIAETFLEDKPENGLVRHKDGNLANNHIDNLEWITQEENAKNTWEKRRENGTTGAGVARGPREKRENIVEKNSLGEKLHSNERLVYIKDEPTDYAISSEGKLRNLKTNYTLKGTKTQGYISYCLRHKKGQTNIFAHRLVAINFIPNPENKEFVDHIDGNRENNNVLNLRWVTQEENMGNLHKNTPYSQKGKSNYSLSLKDEPNEYWKQYGTTSIWVSNLGRVKNKSTGKILRGHCRLDGYHEVKCIEIPEGILTHRLVWRAFQGEILEGKVINHINGIKSDNRLENLEQISFQENLQKASLETNSWGFRKVGSYDEKGQLVATYANATVAAKAINILPSSMRNTIRRAGKCHDGLFYKYLEE